jgi:hypothetical protein
MGCPKAFVLQAIIQLSRNQYMLHDTSIKAWIEKLESVGPDERAVLYAARKEPATIRELAVRLRREAGREALDLKVTDIDSKRMVREFEPPTLCSRI